MNGRAWSAGTLVLALACAAAAAGQEYTVGGLIYADPDDPLASGIGGVTVTVRGPGGEFTVESQGPGDVVPGLWTVEGVVAGTYTVMPHGSGLCFRHRAHGVEQGALPLIIMVDDVHRAGNESIEFVPADTGGCDDGDPCTAGDACADGVCAGVPVPDCDPDDPPQVPGPPLPPAPPVVIDDGTTDPCGADSDGDSIADCADQCPGSAAADLVDAVGCSCAQKSCDDGNACTLDGCSAGQCAHQPLDCIDDDPCTVDRCVGGACLNEPRDCDDGDPCTADACVGGRCTAEPLCADGESCNDGRCQPAQDAPECLDDADCADALFCNGAETCVAGRCIAGAVPCGQDGSCSESQRACGAFVTAGVTDEAAPAACGAFGAGNAALLMVIGLAALRRRRGI